MANSQQQISLFSKKFVTDSVREILKCSSCRFSFSSKYDYNRVTSKVKGNRPILLPCAHSMCENCIQQNYKNLVCPVCSRPVPVPKHLLEGKREFQFRFMFEQNFFMVGILRHLHYFPSENLADSSLFHGSDSSHRVNQTSFNVPKCNECDIASAAGKCATCAAPNNFLCKPCFAKIHENSKILKSHKLIKWEKLTQNGLSYLPKPEFCKTHIGKPCDQYCPKCEKIVCYSCAKHKHQRHNYHSLERRNAHYIDYIFELLENVKQSHEQVRKAQRVSWKIKKA